MQTVVRRLKMMGNKKQKVNNLIGECQGFTLENNSYVLFRPVLLVFEHYYFITNNFQFYI
jgi:hypothetical protein